jgi:hypothetical protein
MTTGWARTFKALVITAVVGMVGVLGCGFLSSRDNIWERFAIASMFGMLGSMIATYGLALVYYVRLRLDLNRRFHSRAPLTDAEFIALSSALKNVDPVLVNLVRLNVAREFRSIGGERFHPGDDLETDLHLSDVTFCGDWLSTMPADLGIEQDEFERDLESVPIKTYGDLVLFLDRLWQQAKSVKAPSEDGRSHPIWDHALDG